MQFDPQDRCEARDSARWQRCSLVWQLTRCMRVLVGCLLKCLQQLFHFSRGIAGDFFRVKLVVGATVMFPFAEYRNPAEPGLGSFQKQEFKQGAVVKAGYPPLLVMILLILIGLSFNHFPRQLFGFPPIFRRVLTMFSWISTRY